MKMALRLIDLISKKTNCTCSTLFLLISKKQICTCSTLFCLFLAVVLHDYNAVLYDYNVKLPSYTLFLWRNCRICLPNILFPVFCLLLFFTAAHFRHAGRYHFSFSHRRFEFPCFFSNEIRLLCFQ